METTPKKKLNLKNATHVHLLWNGDLSIGYSSTHKDSGKRVDWQETVLKDDLPFKLTISKSYWRKDLENYSFKSIYLCDYLTPMLNDVTHIELYPKNNSEENPVLLRSLYFTLKSKAKIPFHFYQYDGKKFEPSEIAIIY